MYRRIAPPTSLANAEEVLKLEDKFADGRKFADDDPKEELKNNGIVEADFTDKKAWDLFPAAQNSTHDLGHLRRLRQSFRRQHLSHRRRRRSGYGAPDVDGECRQAGPGQHSRPSGPEDQDRVDWIADKPTLSPHGSWRLTSAEKHRSLAHVCGELPAVPATYRSSRRRFLPQYSGAPQIPTERADHRRYASFSTMPLLIRSLTPHSSRRKARMTNWIFRGGPADPRNKALIEYRDKLKEFMVDYTAAQHPPGYEFSRTRTEAMAAVAEKHRNISTFWRPIDFAAQAISRRHSIAGRVSPPRTGAAAELPPRLAFGPLRPCGS